MSNPLSSFGIESLVTVRLDITGTGLSLTNNSFYQLASLSILVLILSQPYGLLGNRLVPNNLSILAESLHASILGMARQTVGYQTMYPFLMTLFGLIVLINLLSNIPYNYASTSALTVSLGLSLTIFLGVTIEAIVLKGWSFLANFVPSGTPNVLLPLLVVIELVSYCARAISLGVRLFANILAGHSLLTIISNMSGKIMLQSLLGLLIVVVPYVLLNSLVGLELAVSFIQGYVFTILSGIYTGEAIKPLV